MEFLLFFQLANTEEYIDGALSGNLGEVRSGIRTWVCSDTVCNFSLIHHSSLFKITLAGIVMAFMYGLLKTFSQASEKNWILQQSILWFVLFTFEFGVIVTRFKYSTDSKKGLNLVDVCGRQFSACGRLFLPCSRHVLEQGYSNFLFQGPQ